MSEAKEVEVPEEPTDKFDTGDLAAVSEDERLDVDNDLPSEVNDDAFVNYVPITSDGPDVVLSTEELDDDDNDEEDDDDEEVNG